MSIRDLRCGALADRRECTRWRDPILRDAVTHSTARDRLVARAMGEAPARLARGAA